MLRMKGYAIFGDHYKPIGLDKIDSREELLAMLKVLNVEHYMFIIEEVEE